jgi:hypothetical protein
MLRRLERNGEMERNLDHIIYGFGLKQPPPRRPTPISITYFNQEVFEYLNPYVKGMEEYATYLENEIRRLKNGDK